MNIIVSDGTGEESTVVEWNDNDISPCHITLAVGGTLTTSAQCLRKLWECLDVLYASPRTESGKIRSS